MSFQYKGLKATLGRHLVTDEELTRQMERLRQQTPKIRAITGRPAQMGDEVVLDYAGFCDGDQFEGGTAQHQTLVLGSGAFIPGFEQQLVGAQPGESVTVNVTFPEQYHAPALAGKAARFNCVVHEIREKSAYELDDDFARAMGAQDLGQLQEQLRESMQQFADERGEMDLRDRLLRMAADTLDYQPGREEVQAAVEEQMEALRAQLGQQGLTMEMYCRFSGSTEDRLRADMRPEAEQTVRIRAAIEKIAELEGVEVTEEDLDSAFRDVCRKNGVTMEQLREVCDEAFEADVAFNVQMAKVMALVRDAAVVVEEK